MIKMKALRAFGFPGVNEGHVSRGREFTVAHEQRARELEEDGLAYRIELKMQKPALNKMEPSPSNKAAEVGPLASAGGTTGEVPQQSSSPPVPPQRPRRLNRSKPNEDLLS